MFLSRFISVSNALPKTSYVKMIDLWLLFNLTIPFAEVAIINFSKSKLYQLPDKGPLANVHWIPARTRRGQEDYQPPWSGTWDRPWHDEREADSSEACRHPSLWFRVSAQLFFPHSTFIYQSCIRKSHFRLLDIKYCIYAQSQPSQPI